MFRFRLPELAMLGLAVSVVSGCAEPNEYQAPPPPSVIVATPLQSDAPEYLIENGETEAVERAEVQARVRGVLKEIRFTPGTTVNENDILYLIEQDEYIVARDAAKAAVAGANADLSVAVSSIAVADAQITEISVSVEKARIDYQRQDELWAERATAKTVWEQAKATLDEQIAAQTGLEANKQSALAQKLKAEADLAKANADLAQAELDLGYTEVKAPITGKITSTAIKVGNMVSDGDVLATIVQPSPIWAYMNVSENLILTLADQYERKNQHGDNALGTPVDLRRGTDLGFPFEGKLDYYDQEGVDQRTGTLKLRAVFENEDRLLIPGLFVRVRIPLGVLEDALLVPELSVGRDQAGTYLLTVDSDNEVERKSVVLGPKFGNMVVIRSGIEATDQVVIEGIQRARPGAKVTPKTETLELPEELVAPSDADPNAPIVEDPPSTD